MHRTSRCCVVRSSDQLGCCGNEQAMRTQWPPREQVPATSSASCRFRNPGVNVDISVGLSAGVGDRRERTCGVRAEFGGQHPSKVELSVPGSLSPVTRYE